KSDLNGLLFKKTKGTSLREVYHILFMAFYDLLIKENKKVQNWQELQTNITGIGDELFNKRNLKEVYKGIERRKIIKSVIGRIQSSFISRNSGDPINEDWTLEFEKILMTSITEQNQIEFKLGTTTIKTGQFNKELVLKIVKTLTAISNLGPKKTG